GSVLLMGLAVNLVAAELLALTIAFYVFVYTIWLKRRTPQNIVVGGAAGAFPPIIGWAAGARGIGWGGCALVGGGVFLDPPAFLGAVAVSHRRLCRSGCADVAGRRRSARDQTADPALHHGALACCRCAVAARRCRGDLRGRCFAAERSVHLFG